LGEAVIYKVQRKGSYVEQRNLQKYCLYGGLIGTGIGIIISWLILATHSHQMNKLFYNQITAIPLAFGEWLNNFSSCNTSPCLLYSFVYSLMIYFIVGVLIGFAIKKTTKKCKKNPQISKSPKAYK
jgi:NhaP-type Na+/H+ or K+/H+ antiporter